MDNRVCSNCGGKKKKDKGPRDSLWVAAGRPTHLWVCQRCGHDDRPAEIKAQVDAFAEKVEEKWAAKEQQEIESAADQHWDLVQSGLAAMELSKQAEVDAQAEAESEKP